MFLKKDAMHRPWVVGDVADFLVAVGEDLERLRVDELAREGLH